VEYETLRASIRIPALL